MTNTVANELVGNTASEQRSPLFLDKNSTTLSIPIYPDKCLVIAVFNAEKDTI